MLCQQCNRNRATARYAEVVDGKVHDLHLCEKCLERYQDSSVTGFELSSAPQLKRGLPLETLPDIEEFEHRCPGCETKLSRVVEDGRVGCVKCYETFGDTLANYLRGVHQAALNVAHRGKMQNLESNRLRIRSELQSKRALLRASLKTEDYETAAVLRDEIAVLETGLKSRTSC